MVIFYAVLAAVILAAFIALKIFNLFNLTFFLIAAIVGLLLPLPAYGITTAIAKDDKQTYNEYWNGYEVSTDQSTINCERDGSCDNTYQCDAYQVMEIEYYTDSKGKSASRMVPKTKYHSCPYSEQETTYVINTTLGGYIAGDSLMTGVEYRAGQGIPGGRVTQPPVLWTAAAERINAGKAGPVTQTHEYKNYILASERSLFKKYSDSIEEYREDGLLPAPASGIVNLYEADKAYFVGDTGLNTAALIQDVAYMNGALGQSLYGDLHMVFVDADEISNPNDYSSALLAYWQSTELKRNTVAKNAIIVIVGVDKSTSSNTDETVEPGTLIASWVKASTGMPVGNERMLAQLESELKNQPVDETFVGRPTYNPSTGEVAATDGEVENILFGVNKFARVSMTSDDEGDNGTGFGYLKDEWTPDAGVMATVYVISSILFTIAFALIIYMGYTVRKDPVKEFFTTSHSRKN